MSVLSEWIKERRRTLGLSQAQVATKLGMNQGQVSHLENGKLMPDSEIMGKLDFLFGKFTGSYTPAQSASTTKKMSDRAKDGLKAYRESKENGFCLSIDANVIITADKNQYIVKQGASTSYFTRLTSLIKYLVASQVRQSTINSVQEICDKLDEIYSLIEKKFDGYDPANVAASAEFIPDDEIDE